MSHLSEGWQDGYHGKGFEEGICDNPTYGLWFDYFMHGVHKQMGKVVKPDLAMLIELLLALMEDLESDWMCATKLDQCDEVASFGVLCW